MRYAGMYDICGRWLSRLRTGLGGPMRRPSTIGPTTARCMMRCSDWTRMVGSSRRARTAQGRGAQRAGEHRSGDERRGRDGVLYREVDADAADRRHRMGRVADAQQAVNVPAVEPVQPDVEVLDIVHRPQLVDPVG